MPGVPESVIAAAFRTAKDGNGQTPGAQQRMDRVPGHRCQRPPVDMASDDVKKLRETLERGMSDEQIAQYVTKTETNIGTTINQAAFAQVTGAQQLPNPESMRWTTSNQSSERSRPARRCRATKPPRRLIA